MFRLQMYEIIFTPNNQAVYILINFLRHFRFQNRRSHKIETPKEKIITQIRQNQTPQELSGTKVLFKKQKWEELNASSHLMCEACLIP